VARSVDVHTKHLAEILRRAAAHRGTAFVEIYQNCLIFNGHAWDHVTEPDLKDDNLLVLEQGKPMIFGKNRDKGLRLRGLQPEIVQLGDGVTEADLLVHDEQAPGPNLASILSRVEPPKCSVPVGVFRAIEKPTYADLLLGQVNQAIEQRGIGDLARLYRAADTWSVAEAPPEGNGR
jgi:2-oxoglutarate/2-oxoacid ferredoxin oxidoreductase subunit beta